MAFNIKKIEARNESTGCASCASAANSDECIDCDDSLSAWEPNYLHDHVTALLAEHKRLTVENGILKMAIDLLTPPGHPTAAECASTITGVAEGEDDDIK